MSDGWEIMIDLVTSWILTAFSAFVPKITGCRMGTAPNGDKGQALPADFFPNLRIFSSFFPCLLPAVYCLLLLSNLSLNQAILSLKQAYLSLNKGYLSLREANLSLPEAILSLRKLNQSHRKPNCSLLSDNCSYLSKEA